MPIAESDVRWVDVPKLSLLEQLYVPAIVSGLVTTGKHLARTLAGKDVTTQFPEERPQIPAIKSLMAREASRPRSGSAP